MGPETEGAQWRVCPRCGEPAGESPFCKSCGTNLTQVDRLPLRAEWEANQPGAEQSRQWGSTEPSSANRTPSTGVQLRGWFAGVWQGGKIALGGAAAVVLLVVLVAALSGGGNGSSGSTSPLSGEAVTAKMRDELASNLPDGDEALEYVECSEFAPGLGGDAVFDCKARFRSIDGSTDWHDNVQLTVLPDKTLSYEDDSSVDNALPSGQVQ
jgi:hypothetical protein